MLRIATLYESHRKEAVHLIHIDRDQIDARYVLPLPQTTGMVYHQNDRNAYEVILTVERLDGSLEGYGGYVIWTYEDGSTAMQDVVIQPPNTIRHAISPALLSKAGEVSVSLVLYREADAYRRTLAQWLCRVLPEAKEPAVPPEQPDIPIIQSLLLDAQRVSRETAAALDRAETVEQGAQAARADAKAAQAGAEGAQIKAEAAQCAAEAARDAASTQAATAGEQAAAAAQSAVQAAGHATAAGTAQAGAEAAKSAAQAAQAGAESARDEAEATLGNMVPNTRTVNGISLATDTNLAAELIGALKNEKLQTFDIPLKSGITTIGSGAKYSVLGNGIVIVDFNVIATNVTGYTIIGTMPAGFWPKGYTYNVITQGDDEDTVTVSFCPAWIRPYNGDLVIGCANTQHHYFFGTFIYAIA